MADDTVPSGDKDFSKEERQRALNSALVIVGLCLVGSGISIAIWIYRGHATVWQWWLVISVSTVLEAVIIVSKKMRVVTYGLLSLSCAIAVLFASSLSVYQTSSAHIQTLPFEAYKLVTLAFAVIAVRPTWVSYLVISTCGVVPVILYYTVFSGIHQAMPIQEPWVVVLFSVISFWFYRFRIKSIETERKLARARAQEEALARIAKVILAVRDLSNSPIQTLIATTALMQNESISRDEIARISDHAIQRLRELSKVLETYEHQIDWSQLPGSFDAVTVLKDAFKYENGAR